MLPNSWLVNRVIKFACLGAVLAELDVLAAPIFGMEGIGVGLRVGPLWLSQGIFLTVKVVLSIPSSVHSHASRMASLLGWLANKSPLHFFGLCFTPIYQSDGCGEANIQPAE